MRINAYDRTVNTTSGPVAVEVPRGTRERVVNTSRVTAEDMVYEDEEPEILSVMPGTGWQAVIGGEVVPLVAFVAKDDATLYGVAVGEDGKVNLEESVEKHPGFSGYKPINDTEEK